MEMGYGKGGWEEHCKDAIAANEGDKERQSAQFCFPWTLTGCDP